MRRGGRIGRRHLDEDALAAVAVGGLVDDDLARRNVARLLGQRLEAHLFALAEARVGVGLERGRVDARVALADADRTVGDLGRARRAVARRLGRAVSAPRLAAQRLHQEGEVEGLARALVVEGRPVGRRAVQLLLVVDGVLHAAAVVVGRGGRRVGVVRRGDGLEAVARGGGVRQRVATAAVALAEDGGLLPPRRRRRGGRRVGGGDGGGDGGEGGKKGGGDGASSPAEVIR